MQDYTTTYELPDGDWVAIPMSLAMRITGLLLLNEDGEAHSAKLTRALKEARNFRKG